METSRPQRQYASWKESKKETTTAIELLFRRVLDDDYYGSSDPTVDWILFFATSSAVINTSFLFYSDLPSGSYFDFHPFSRERELKIKIR